MTELTGKIAAECSRAYERIEQLEARLAEAEALLRKNRNHFSHLFDTLMREDFGTYSICPGIAESISAIDAAMAGDKP